MKPAKLLRTKVEVTVGKAIFSANGNVVEDEAFLKVYPYMKIISGEAIDSAYEKGETLNTGKLNLLSILPLHLQDIQRLL